ncbi:MAG: YgcG family protein [Pseudomonadota bacterium]
MPLRAALAAAALALGTAVLAQLAVPPVARVTDLTGTLTGAQQAELSRRLADFEAEKGAQIAVLIVPSTEPETIEQYALRVAEAWQLGRQGVDDGALLLIAKNDRRLRIEVGYGLEGVLPDAIAKRIIAETIAPYLRSGDWYGGVRAGVEQMLAVIQGEPLPEPQRRSTRDGRGWDGFAVLLIIPLLIGQALRRLFGALPAGLLMGGLAGLVVWLVSGTVLLGAFVGFIVFALVLGGIAGYMGGFGGRHGGFGGGGFGGGFRGGGGRFGGGGASGGW